MLRKMGNKLERIEEDIFLGRSEEVVRDISNAKQEIINFRKIIRPQRPVLRDLERTKQRYIADDLEIYFDDIVDASERIWDMLENYKEVVEALEDTNESVISHRVNDVLRVLTAFSVVILPLTLIASIWGMNVGVPGEGSTTAFWVIIGVDGRCCWPGCSATSAGAAGSSSHPYPDPLRAIAPQIDPAIFKAYDVRGLYGEQIDEDVAYRIGRGFARVLADLEGTPAERAAAGARPRHAPVRARAGRALRRRACATRAPSVLDVGMVGTEMLYFTVGSRDLDGGLMCTASHNPKAYTGAKLVGRGAIALSGDSGIGELRDDRDGGRAGRRRPSPPGDYDERGRRRAVPRATRSRSSTRRRSGR